MRELKQVLYIGVLFGTVMLAGCSATEETGTPTKSNEASKVLTHEQTKESMLEPTNDMIETTSPVLVTKEQLDS